MKFTTAIIIITFVLLTTLLTSTNAIKGHQQPNTIISVPFPRVTTVPNSVGKGHDNGNGKDSSKDVSVVDKGPPGCNCEFIGRLKDKTPEECVDYCIWRWGWY